MPKQKIFVLQNRLEGGVLSKIGSKEVFSKIDSKGDFFLKFEEFFIGMIILQKVILYTPVWDQGVLQGGNAILPPDHLLCHAQHLASRPRLQHREKQRLRVWYDRVGVGQARALVLGMILLLLVSFASSTSTTPSVIPGALREFQLDLSPSIKKCGNLFHKIKTVGLL